MPMAAAMMAMTTRQRSLATRKMVRQSAVLRTTTVVDAETTMMTEGELCLDTRARRTCDRMFRAIPTRKTKKSLRAQELQDSVDIMLLCAHRYQCKLWDKCPDSEVKEHFKLPSILTPVLCSKRSNRDPIFATSHRFFSRSIVVATPYSNCLFRT